jgi:molybdopterin-biosynthesis enzyme MoeA-like protein
MRMTEVVFAPGFPKEIKEVVEPLIERHSWLMGDRLHRLDVVFGLTEDEADASMNILLRYHEGVLSVNSGFLRYDEPQRDRCMAHELAHVVSQGVLDEMWDIVEHLIAPDLGPYVRKKVIREHERLTDLIAEVSLGYED